MAIRILSANCQGLSSIEKRLDVLNYLKDKKSDIYCLQDTHTTKASERFFRSQWNNECIFSSGTSNSRGVAILFSKNLGFKIHNHISDPEGNYIICDMSVEDNKFTLINLYGPNKDTPLVFENIINIAETIGNTSLIICDFNTVQDEKLDFCNYKCINNKNSFKKILEIKESYNLYDPFRETYPSLKRYTWRKKSPLKQACLDFLLISEALLPSVNKSSIEASYRSDHSMIILDISFIQFQKGKPLWKHNNSLLHDKDYIKLINEKIDEIKRQYALPVYDIENIQNIPDDQIQFTINDQLFLETLLKELRGKLISYSSYKKKEREKRETDLIKNIGALESNLSNTNINDIDNLKEELTTIRKNKMQGILVRSRAQLIEDDEKPTIFCFVTLRNTIMPVKSFLNE